MLSVTVITLTYNNLSQLEKTLASFFRQSLKGVDHIQYIVADDGSDAFVKEEIYDRCIKMAGGNSENYEIVVYSNGINIGTVKSLNRALGKATGDIIIPLNCGDEFFSNDSLNQIVRCFEASTAPIITGFRQIVSEEKVVGIKPKKRVLRLFRPGKEFKLLKRLAVNGNFISGASTYYSRSYLNSVGGFDEKFRLLEDYPFILKALHEGARIDFFDRIFMKHSVGGVSDPSLPRNKSLNDDLELLFDWVSNNVSMTWMDKRFFSYNHGLSKVDKLKVKNVLLYPDCMLRKIFDI